MENIYIEVIAALLGVIGFFLWRTMMNTGSIAKSTKSFELAMLRTELATAGITEGLKNHKAETKEKFKEVDTEITNIKNDIKDFNKRFPNNKIEAHHA